MSKRAGNVGFTVMALLLCLLPAAAQVGIGDDVKLNLSGDVAVGYNGAIGDIVSSSHGLNYGGNGVLRGYYYNPQFLSFDIQPYYNRSQSNSSFQSISDSSGFIGTANLFTGSHFPGSITYARNYDSTGQFGIPGASGLTTAGSGQTLTIAWGLMLPNLPSLNASFSLFGQNSSVPGANSENHSGSRNLNLNSDYVLRGFRLHGFFTHLSTDGVFPGFLAGEPPQDSSTGSNAYGIQASHKIPLNGYWSAGFNRSAFGGESGGGAMTGVSEGTNDSFTTGVNLNPTRKVSVGLNALYQSNVFGVVQQEILQAGGTLPALVAGTSASSLSMSGSVFYTISPHIGVNGQFSHQEQYSEGGSRGFTQYGGGVYMNYSRPLLGSLNFSVGANDTATQAGNSGASLYGNVNFSRRLHGWELGANFNYSQAVQTLFALYTSSQYGYGASVRRKLGDRFYWNGVFSASHSGLTQQAGSSSHAETFSTVITYHRYTLNGLYSQSSGIAVLTPQGLVAVPTVPSPLLPAPVLYLGRSVGGGLSATVMRFTLSLSYAKASSETNTGAKISNNGTTMMNGRIRYRVRKLYLDAGFTRFGQSVSAAQTPPGIINTYYIGVSRWFNVF